MTEEELWLYDLELENKAAQLQLRIAKLEKDLARAHELLKPSKNFGPPLWWRI